MQEMGDKNIRSNREAGDTINADAERSMGDLANKYEAGGTDAPAKLSAALIAGAASIAGTSAQIANEISAPLSGLGTESSTWGQHMLAGFNSGLVDEWNFGTLFQNVRNIAQSITNVLGFSVPKEGPMSNADKWGPDMVRLIADGIQSEQGRLIKQVERMSGAIEEAFDPTLTVDAAYEALDTIGKNRQKAYGAIVESKSEPSISINLNMNLSNVSIRDDSDIERLAKVMSQEMASQAARQLAGRLG